ncbi:MAG: hypothetical protein GY757_40700, partial [bacterium]|nr:hypothetical protein [bacterium]
VNIYSLTDFKLKKRFGKAGEGPQEFRGAALIRVQPDTILVNSRNKLSFFGRDGAFKKEMRVASGKRFAPLGKHRFVGQGFAVDNGTGYETVNIYNANLEKVSELSRRKSPIQQSGEIPVLSTPQFFRTYKNKVYYLNKRGFEINVADDKGKKLFTINRDYKLREFNAQDRAGFEKHFKTSPSTRKNYQLLKNRIVYPTDYPAVRQLRVSEDMVFVLTFKKIKGNLSELFLFDTKGKFLKKAMLPLVEKNAFLAFPFALSKGKVYQVVEISDDQWELQISNIK